MCDIKTSDVARLMELFQVSNPSHDKNNVLRRQTIGDLLYRVLCYAIGNSILHLKPTRAKRILMPALVMAIMS